MSNPSTQLPPMTPYLTLSDAGQAISFYKGVFNATEVFRLTYPDSEKVCHAELLINGSRIMLGEEHPDMTKSPTALGGTSVRLCLMVDDVDAWMDRAVKAGATVTFPAEEHFYGHRSGSVRDPFGHEWMFNHETEKVEAAEMQRRWKEMMKK
jgi:PhnB protein